MTLETTEPSLQQWDDFVREQPRAHILQRANWGELKAAFGWRVVRVGLTYDDHLVAGAQILLRSLPLGVATMGYLPMGPYAPTDEALSALWDLIDQRMRAENAAFLKWEPGIFEGGSPDLERWGFRESSQTVQPPNTILLDVMEEDDEILSRMSQSTRRKVRLSWRKGVRYYEGTREDVDTFTQMMNTTGNRNDFGVHDPDYYRAAYDLFVPDGSAALILAEHEGDPLAGLMVFAGGRTAWYLYGASSNQKRNLMATYGVQWEAIQWAKARGMHAYDFWGIPDEDEDTLEDQFKDRTDGLWGVYGFKRGWGGEVVRSAGAWDKVYNPLIYTAYRTALQFRE
ncbi:MAG: peptidoglycan bridge formation glycyltransferase FemA/FemB family protein [Chloroflexota bacterium]